ncbi:MAG TPA: nickel pincer cofactor biosynthesis protein LarB [Rectinemataceae bacterium]|nr:nickel pincer cofactor biosynthesis protein LarB [Rectinemataceae bacterium]
MTDERLKEILEGYRKGKIDLAAALAAFEGFPTADMGYARLDTARELRVGFPEVVFCMGKTPAQVEGIVRALVKRGSRVLATRAVAEQFEALRDLEDLLVFDPVSRTIRSRKGDGEAAAAGGSAGSAAGDHAASAANRAASAVNRVAVVTAGTSDIPVAEEAAVTAEACGASVDRIFDVGVAGIHRLFERIDDIRAARVVVTVAGMEGALASVVGGLVAAPVIAVPTSVGYGASFGGLAALLAMLNSCAAGVTVVNIDNGFGAGYQAALIARGG